MANFQVTSTLTAMIRVHLVRLLLNFLDHWMHEHPKEDVPSLVGNMYRWLRWHDGKNVLLADKSEAGWMYIPDRGFDVEQNTIHGEFIPEHVHHNYLHTNAYKESREKRGVEGAAPGQFLEKGKFSSTDRW
jgi:hypothetical protein